MVRETNEVFIPIPKVRNHQIKVEVNGDDLTSRVIESKWVKPLMNLGIGSFTCKLSNAGGQLSDTYAGGQTVKFIADNSTKTRMQFWGRIDYPRDILEKDGQYLELIGRHRAWFLSERKVCHTATDTDCVDILKSICDKEAPELDQTALPASTGVNTDVEWDYKPFPEAVAELMSKSGYDCRVDNDLKIRLFEANSILNENEAISENDNFRSTEELGNDTYYERTRVTVAGEDDNGIPIIYTAISGVDDSNYSRESEESIREIYQKEPAANTMDKVKKLAQALLAQYTNRPKQGKFKTLGLETLEPGENLWVAVPRQKIYGQYKALQVTQTFGMKDGGWRTETVLENELVDNERIIQNILSKTGSLSVATNPNKLKYSFNVPFDDATYDSSKTHVSESDGKLVLVDEIYPSGEWISTTHTAPVNVSQVELRVKGKDLGASKFYYSLNNGVSWTAITKSTLLTAGQVGQQVKLKCELIRSYYNTGPELDSIALLYS